MARRVVLLNVVLLITLAAALVPPSAFAESTTTTLSPATVLAGRAYAMKLLDEQAVPEGATLVQRFTTHLPMQSEPSITLGLQTATHRYVLPASIVLDEFVLGHLRKGESVTSTGTSNGPGQRPTDSVSLTLPCSNPHVTYCSLQYATTQTTSGQTELRIDVQVDWLPIANLKMPTNGVVSVTGYGDTSLPQGSSHPFTVVLSHQQALALRVVISKLKESGGGICSESVTLLKISVSSATSSSVQWRATANTCPGVLSVSRRGHDAQLDDHNCALWQLVRSFFPAGAADATKGAIGYCGE